MNGVTIKDAAERSGLTPGAIRMWEQRYGFPVPRRTPAGHRRYELDDVETLQRAVGLRDQGLSVPAALERARDVGVTDRPSIYAAIVGAAAIPGRPSALRKRTLVHLSRAIEDETMARAAAPVCFGAFQREAFYRRVEHRYRRMAASADCVAVFADFAGVRHATERLVEIPVGADSAMGAEWAVIVDAPGYAACLVAREEADSSPERVEDDGERRFEALVTLDPMTVRAAARVATRIAAAADPEDGDRLERLLSERPLAFERPAPALTALTNRILAYVDRG
jgi:MerR family transcriptional regulator, light-induced transcriptional regulator